MNKTVGFIGSGNMGSAIMGGIIEKGIVGGKNIIASDPNEASLNKLKEKYNINTTTDNKETAGKSDILILSIKPVMFPNVINEIKGEIKDETLIISIAAGQTVSKIEKLFEKEIKLIRIMPNTPALVAEAMSAIVTNKNVSKDDLDITIQIFSSIGKCEVVEEGLIDAITGISGSSPAYVYMFIEAMADAGVRAGLKREQAYKFASQAVLGSAKMVLETNMHPGELKDMVCSPSGTTIDAVYSLEKDGFRGSVMRAVDECIKKSVEMSGE